ncbi:protein O-mannosyl-transferase family [Nioella halotolerans]|uniref:protein O-mannosyl-transferase family n=1 Tax=Nioella halotolerans TaxID=2303578 RepID=UPI003F6564B5
MSVTETTSRTVPGMQGNRTQSGLVRVSIALGLLAFWAAYYAWCLFPGLGGVMNAGDTAKFQTLGHSQILVHGPGYPLVLFLGAVLRALDLPVEPWRAMTFAMAALPGAVANMMAFLIVARVTRSLLFGIAGSLLLGSAGLMAVQSTEAEVYPLALAFVLSTTFLLILFIETKREGYFVAACGVYALSFGNHLMMIMLVPLFLLVTAVHWRRLLRPRMVASVLGLVALGASQYLYLAYMTHHPGTAYSEYLPLPPTANELVQYISGSYFSGLYGSGLRSTYSSETLLATLRSAHPWISSALILTGLGLFLVGARRRDAGWFGAATVFGVALSFVPFVVWYGAYDIQAFHLPVLGPLLVGAVAAVGWWLARGAAGRGGAADRARGLARRGHGRGADRAGADLHRPARDAGGAGRTGPDRGSAGLHDLRAPDGDALSRTAGRGAAGPLPGAVARRGNRRRGRRGRRHRRANRWQAVAAMDRASPPRPRLPFLGTRPARRHAVARLRLFLRRPRRS